jgi:hypothetical protein
LPGSTPGSTPLKGATVADIVKGLSSTGKISRSENALFGELLDPNSSSRIKALRQINSAKIAKAKEDLVALELSNPRSTDWDQAETLKRGELNAIIRVATQEIAKWSGGGLEEQRRNAFNSMPEWVRAAFEKLKDMQIQRKPLAFDVTELRKDRDELEALEVLTPGEQTLLSTIKTNLGKATAKLQAFDAKISTLETALASRGYGSAAKKLYAGYATGGYVTGPGSGTSDSITAKLSNGEYVIKADAVKKIGVDKLNKLNSGNSKAIPDVLAGIKEDDWQFGNLLRVDRGVMDLIGLAVNGYTPNRKYSYNSWSTIQKIFDPLASVAQEIVKANGIDSGKPSLRKTKSTDNSESGGLFESSGKYGTVAIDNESYNVNGQGPIQVLSHELGHYIGHAAQTLAYRSMNYGKDVPANVRKLVKMDQEAELYEYTAQALSGVIMRLSGQTQAINSDFYRNKNLFRKGNTTHPNIYENATLLQSGYAHPAETLKFLGFKLPKKYSRYDLGGYDNVPYLSDKVNKISDARKDKSYTMVNGKKVYNSDFGYEPTLGFATGGYVSGTGTGTSDSIFAKLSNGEYVMNAKATSAYGADFMNALNQQRVTFAQPQTLAQNSNNSPTMVYLSPEDRALLRAAVDRPVELYTENTKIAQSANAGNLILAQRGMR